MTYAEELAAARPEFEAKYGQVWDTDQLRAEFEVVGFQAPLVVAVRKSDGVKGSLQFSGSPRFYFGWEAA